MRRPRNRHRTPASGTTAAPARPQSATERPRLDFPGTLTSRQRRLVNTVRFHGRCFVLSAHDYGWAVLYAPARNRRPGELRYEPLCRVPDKTVRSTLRTGVLTHRYADEQEHIPGLPEPLIAIEVTAGAWSRPEQAAPPQNDATQA